jgi:hypothetical protein
MWAVVELNANSAGGRELLHCSFRVPNGPGAAITSAERLCRSGLGPTLAGRDNFLLQTVNEFLWVRIRDSGPALSISCRPTPFQKETWNPHQAVVRAGFPAAAWLTARACIETERLNWASRVLGSLFNTGTTSFRTLGSDSVSEDVQPDKLCACH